MNVVLSFFQEWLAYLAEKIDKITSFIWNLDWNLASANSFPEKICREDYLFKEISTDEVCHLLW